MASLPACPVPTFVQSYNVAVNRPPKGAQAVPTVFGLIFMAFGLAFASGFVFASPGHVQGSRWVGVAISAFFALIGGGIIYAGIYGTRKLKEQAAIEQSNPASPWLWRKDWAASRAESTNRNTSIGLWFFAVFWNVIAFSVAGSVVPQLWRNSDLKALFPLAMCVVGVILAGAAIRATIRRERFGQTHFAFAALPFSPGRVLKGTIHLHFNTVAKHGVDLRLSCVRRVVTGSGKERSTRESVLWEADKNVPQELLTPGAMSDATIPVEFSIPSDAYESNHDQTDDQVLWLLHAKADIPGVDYSDDFEVPVFRLTPSAASASESAVFSSSETQGATVPPAFQSDASDVAAPQNPKVVVSDGMNGSTRFYFPPLRNPVRVLVLILITAVWTGILYFLGHSQAPWIFPVVFTLFDLVLIYGLIQTATGSSRIEVGSGKVVFRRAVMGIGSVREIPFSDVAQILPVTTARQAGSRESYLLRLRTKSGEQVTLADAIEDRQEARWVAAQLEKFVGLKLDTHVAVDAGFGTYGPPPQRGQTASPVFRRNRPVAIAVGLAFFLVWAGIVGSRILSVKHANPTRISKTSGVARSSLHQVTHSPLTDTDVEHLQALPAQSQAEELLERAIQHDLRALDIFEQNIGSWSNLTRTAQMNQLDERSRYSTDLRVRYANADLNLALNGLPKIEATADQLIALAHADPAHRAYSVYSMGMLAGRGVAYDRIYPVLLDYAKNDADLQVRQWAVEGMRFLGTDEALDQLFNSFTHDPSNAVRDRAGCNVSDCGTFKRQQRMRMVPKLIDLAADPGTTPQMRNWTFLALHEITDETLPADASAWQAWYAEHGAEKMAEFEQQDWWKVRGDQ